MTKKILLAAVAASAMAFAGAASAHTVTFIAGAAGAPIDAADTGGAALPYKLAIESTAATPTFQNFAMIDTLSGGNLPSGNVLVTLKLTGGVYGAAVTAAAVTAGAGCTTFTATPSSGGALNSDSVTFIISNSAPDCSTFNLNLPIKPNAGASVIVTSTLTTESNTPIDGRDASLTVLTRPSAFNAVINGTIGATGALTDTLATLTVTPVYTTFLVGGAGHAGAETATVGQLGTVEVLADTAAFKDLALNKVVIGDVSNVVVTTTGSFTAFNGAGGSVTLGGVAAATTPGATAVHSGAALDTAVIAAGTTAAPVTPEAFIVTRNTAASTVIPSSTYAVSVAYTLASAYTAEGPFAGNFETIQRDGTNVVLPWMNSTSIQATSGSTNIVRLGNIASTVSGPVYAQILNSTGTPSTNAVVQLFPSIAANKEVLITTAALTTALGEFGRGDVQISVEAPSNTITARRFVTLSNGSVTEMPSGTVASDQNQVNVP